MSTIDDKLALANDNVPKVYAAGVKGGGATNLQNGESTGSLKSVLALDAVSEGAVALGTDTTAGLKCFNITAFDDANKTYTLDSVEGLEVGDVFSLEMTKDYDNVGQITAITDTKVTVDTYQGNDGGMHTLFRVPLKPTCGTVYCGENTFVAGKGTLAKGDNAVAMGLNTQAKGDNSVAEGEGSIASGKNAKASGTNAQAISEGAVAFGKNSIAGSKCFNVLSFDDTNKSYTLDSVEGLEVGDVFSLFLSNHYDEYGKITAISGSVVTVDNYKPEEVGGDKCFRIPLKPQCGTTDFGVSAFAEGEDSMAVGDYSHAEGYGTKAKGRYAHAEGFKTEANYAAHSEGRATVASGLHSHAEGYNTKALGKASHTEGTSTTTSDVSAHAEGHQTEASNVGAHAEGHSTVASGYASHAEGRETIASGEKAHAEGYYSEASGEVSHAEGFKAKATELYAHAEGNKTVASGKYSHAEGEETKTKAQGSHAEGGYTQAQGLRSHAEGGSSYAYGQYAHAEGHNTGASGTSAHAEGEFCLALKRYSHAEGNNTWANSEAQHVQGKYNLNDPNDEYAHIVGNGTSNQRSNAHTLDWDGNAWFAGDIENGTGDKLSKKLDNATPLNSMIANNITTETFPLNADGIFDMPANKTTYFNGGASDIKEWYNQHVGTKGYVNLELDAPITQYYSDEPVSPDMLEHSWKLIIKADEGQTIAFEICGGYITVYDDDGGKNWKTLRPTMVKANSTVPDWNKIRKVSNGACVMYMFTKLAIPHTGDLGVPSDYVIYDAISLEQSDSSSEEA